MYGGCRGGGHGEMGKGHSLVHRGGASYVLEDFKIDVMAHLLPRPDAVFLHRVAQCLFLLIVPVPPEGHGWRPLLLLRNDSRRVVHVVHTDVCLAARYSSSSFFLLLS